MKKIFYLLFINLLAIGSHAQLTSSADLSTESFEIKENQQGKYFLVGKESKKILFDNLDTIYFNYKTELYVIQKNKKYGVISQRANVLIPLQYDKIDRMGGGLLSGLWEVEKDHKKGIWQIGNREIIPTTYSSINFSSIRGNEFIVENNGKYGTYDIYGKLIYPAEYDLIKNVKGILQLTKNNNVKFLIGNELRSINLLTDKTIRYYDTKGNSFTLYLFEKESKQGVINDEGVVIIDPIYDEINPRTNMDVSKPLYENYLFVRIDRQWGAIDIKNNILIPIEYESAELVYPYLVTLGINSYKKLYDLEKKQFVITHDFERYFRDGKYTRIEKDGLDALIDNETMKVMIPYKYKSILWNKTQDKFIAKNLEGKMGMIDINENVIIPFEYERLECFCDDKLLIVKKDQLGYGIIDKKNQLLFPFSPNYIWGFSDRFEININNKIDIYDCDLKKVN